MNHPFKPYPHYKPSGIEWLGDIPEHWGVRRLKTHVENVSEQTKGHNNGDLCLALEHVESWTGKYEEIGIDSSLDSQVKRFQSDDVLFCKLRPYLAKVVRPHCSGVCVSEFLVLRPSDGVMTARYLEHLLRSKPVIDAIDASTFGAKMPRANWQFIGTMRYPIPPLSEQAAMVAYLDKKTDQIDLLIEKIEKKIELLKEKRTILINQCVTKGLDPNVEMKDSGVEWIGRVPVYWDCDRVGRATYVKGRIGWKGLRSEDFLDEGPFLVTGTDFVSGKIDWSNCHHVDQERYEEDPFIILQNDDVLITKDGSIGKVAHVTELPHKATLNSGIFVTRPINNQYQQRYFYWVISSPIFSDFVGYNSSGSTILHLYQNVFERFVFPIPPLQEQKLISRYLDKKIGQIDLLIEKLQSKISLTKEYRQCLISSVVTGKLDLREA